MVSDPTPIWQIALGGVAACSSFLGGGYWLRYSFQRQQKDIDRAHKRIGETLKMVQNSPSTESCSEQRETCVGGIQSEIVELKEDVKVIDETLRGKGNEVGLVADVKAILSHLQNGGPG